MKSIRCPIIGLFAAAFCFPVYAETLISDTFNNTREWSRLSDSGTLALVTTSPGFASVPYARLTNGVFCKDLGKMLTTDFTLTFNTIHERWSRSIIAGLTNAEGTRGYGMRWASNNGPAQFRGNGSVFITKFDGRRPSMIGPTYYGENLTQAAGSNRPAALEGGATSLATITLSWVAATSTLTLSVDGMVNATVTDTTYNSFSRIFIGGSTGTIIDNLDLDTAELPVPIAATLSGPNESVVYHPRR